MKQELRTLISAAVTASVDWGSRIQGAKYPGVVLQSVSKNGSHTFDGPDGTFVSRVQVDVYAEKYREAETISQEILNQIDGYRGGKIMMIFFRAERDGREAGDTKRPFRISQDFEIHWRL
ncbi:DUF3168 domain-containing protein [Cribrihabitans marinus]|uniref:DUF3168 domain-containing protein n=1 Tax=Cribrihabitans marinus TaxID=1227549 RepID=UPI000B83101D|nr:DUF3168 domain-containing protein [Cribrihabitans marinus]GGH24438.1 hypothetical protein GCM10010973_10940 [Cribrihabitans marinus]